MNVGYIKFDDLDNSVNNDECPICGKNIYVSKYYNNFACIDINCPLGHGAKELTIKINNILLKLENK